MQIVSFLAPAGVFPAMAARDKRQVLKQLSTEAAQATGLPEREIFSALVEREAMGCTGMGNGICIPHGRFESLSRVFGLFARLKSPIDFGAEDEKPVDLVFLLLTPQNATTEHMKALASVSRALRGKTAGEKLRAAASAEALYEILSTEPEENGA